MVRVFHCDDSLAYRELIRAELEDDPELELVGDGADVQAALAGVAEQRPDVVLLDLVTDAEPVVAALRAAAPGVRVVILSGHSREYGERRTGGAEAYVQKDAPFEELRATVLRVAAG